MHVQLATGDRSQQAAEVLAGEDVAVENQEVGVAVAVDQSLEGLDLDPREEVVAPAPGPDLVWRRHQQVDTVAEEAVALGPVGADHDARRRRLQETHAGEDGQVGLLVQLGIVADGEEEEDRRCHGRVG